MVRYKVNLIRDRVPDRRRRRRVYALMVAYFLACGTVLVAVAHRQTRALVQAAAAAHEMREIEDRFRATHPDAGSLVRYAEALRENMEQAAEQIETLKAELERRPNVSRILLCLLAEMPADMRISNFRLNLKERTLAFDLLVPELRPEEAPGFPVLLGRWKQSPRLGTEVERLRAVSTKREVFGEEPILMIRMQGTLVNRSA